MKFLAETIKLIKKSTEISRNHLTPEIQLHLITPSCCLWSARSEAVPFQDPFWAFYWPGGQALTRYILDNPRVVANLNVLDVGSGCGATAIAAVKSGAKFVTANDTDLVACAAIKLNSNLNGVFVEISSDNQIGKPVHEWDCLLIGDMFYDPDFARIVLPWLQNCVKAGKHVFIGDPGRYALLQGEVMKHLQLLKEYPLLNESALENNGFKFSSVWGFVKC